MGKFWEKCLASFIVVLFVFTLFTPVTAKADNMATGSGVEYGDPIEEFSYIDENGYYITERIYFKPDAAGITTRSKSGSGWYKNEKEFKWDNGLSRSTFYYAEGHFIWGDGDVNVDEHGGGWDYIPSNATAFDASLTTKKGGYGLIFNWYDSVTFSFTIKNVIGIETDCSVTVRVSESGNQI